MRAALKEREKLLQVQTKIDKKCKVKEQSSQDHEDNNTKSKKGVKIRKKHMKNILMLGDSLVKHLDRRKVKGSLRNGQNVNVKSFSGATVDDMLDYSKPPMKRNHEIVILHVGTDSVATNKPAEEIAIEMKITLLYQPLYPGVMTHH